MSKEVIRVTVVMEYAPVMKNYTGCSTVAEAAAYDERENPFLECPDVYLLDDEIVSVTFEAVTV